MVCLQGTEDPWMETNTVTIKPLLIVVAVIIFIEAVTGYLLFREQYHPMIIMGLERITQVFLMVLIILTWGGGLPSLGLSYPAIMPGFKKGLIWSASVGAVTILALVVVFIAGGDPFTWIHTDLPSGRTDLLLFFLVGGIIAPVAEEVFFRGVLYGFFRRWGVRAALVLSTVLFVLSHPLGYGIPWPQIMGGMLFAVAYEMTGSLMTPIILHVLGNLAIFSIPLISRIAL
ncbi:MAG: CPBP family intramembrane metalloprotease [Syntrophobacterales bacterium]|nr:MAG: CPBP family intramembrane metalloprotease [Syntrophobacterales bacterium]